MAARLGRTTAASIVGDFAGAIATAVMQDDPMHSQPREWPVSEGTGSWC